MIVQRAEDVDDAVALDEERRQVLPGLLRHGRAGDLRRDLRAARVHERGVGGDVRLAVRRRGAGVGDGAEFGESAHPSRCDLPALDLLFQLEDRVHQAVRRRRAARHPDVDRDDLVDALHDVVGAIEAARGRAGAHGDDVLRLRHLVVDLLEHRRDLVDDRAGHDHQVRLPRREAHDLGAEARDVVVRGDHRHELDGAAGRAEGERPERVAARPVRRPARAWW